MMAVHQQSFSQLLVLVNTPVEVNVGLSSSQNEPFEKTRPCGDPFQPGPLAVKAPLLGGSIVKMPPLGSFHRPLTVAVGSPPGLQCPATVNSGSAAMP